MIDLDTILHIVADIFHVSIGDIRGRRRFLRHMRAKHAVCYLLIHAGYGVTEAAEMLGRHYTTVASSAEAAEQLIRDDATYAAQIRACQAAMDAAIPTVRTVAEASAPSRGPGWPSDATPGWLRSRCISPCSGLAASLSRQPREDAMKLEAVYDHLLSKAKRSGNDERVDLKGGARLAVRVWDGQIALTVARSPQRVGVRELITFRQICRVSETAKRIPSEGQAQRTDDEGKVWHVVGFVWRREDA